MQLNFMIKDSQVWEDCFSMPFERLANAFASILNGGRSLKRQFAVAAFSRFPIGCCIANYPIEFKSLRSFTSAEIQKAGGIA